MPERLMPPDMPVRLTGGGGLYSSLAIALIFFVTAFSGRADVRFDTFLGYDGIEPEGTWIPVVCEIQNDGPAFEAVVEVTETSMGNDATERLPVELPSGTIKRVVIPAFCQTRYQNTWRIRLLDDRGLIRKEQNVEPRKHVTRDAFVIGSLARTPGGAPIIRPTTLAQQEMQPASARFQPDIFPDNPLTLEGLSALYLNSEEISKLSPAQSQAILQWLYAGGHLIVAVEQVADVTAAGWLDKLMPCSFGDTKALPRHSEIEDWLRTSGSVNPTSSQRPQRWIAPRAGQVRPAPQSAATPDNPFADLTSDTTFELGDVEAFQTTLRDGNVILAADNTPLVITANRGLGRVTALTFSPEREPFRSWRNLPTFWAKIAGVPGQYYLTSAQNNYGGTSASADGIFGAMIDSRQVHKLPASWLLLLLVVYLVVIGPFDQYWLKRINRPMLTWITFPCYVIFFSLMIYFIGYKLRAGESEWNELHVVDVIPNGDHAELRGTTFASIYSPANQNYHTKGQEKEATLRGEFRGSFYGQQSSERLEVADVGDSFDSEVFVGVWSSRLIVSDWWQPANLPFEVKTEPVDGGWKLTVANHSGRTLTNARLITPDLRMHELGQFAPNEARTVTVMSNQGQPIQDFVMAQGQNFQNVQSSRNQALGNTKAGQISDLPDASTAVSFISLLDHESTTRSFEPTPGVDIANSVEHGSAVLVAWADDYSPVPQMNQFTPRRSHRQTLWRMPVDLNPAAQSQ